MFENNQRAEIESCSASTLPLVRDGLETVTHCSLDAAQLMFKDRDELDRDLSPNQDALVRRHLGAHCDVQWGCFDWDLAMKLHQSRCGAINKQQHVRWRKQSLAFEMSFPE